MTLEVKVDENGYQKIKVNGKEIDNKAFKVLEDKRIKKLDKANKTREAKMMKKIDAFAKRNKLEKNSNVKKAYEDARNSITLKLKKNQIENFATLNTDLLIGIEKARKSVSDLAAAMLSTEIDPYAFISSNKQGAGIGIYIAEKKCPNESHITNYTKISGAFPDKHGENVLAIARGVSPNSYIYCRDKFTTAKNQDLPGYGGNPRIYIESYSYSKGQKTYLKKYSIYDYFFEQRVYDNMTAIFKSAGNIKTISEINGAIFTTTTYKDVTTPGKAFNVITVGNYDDMSNNISNGSVYGDPETKNQKPEIVAPGVRITAGGHTFSGTSMSAPHAAGFAANLMSEFSYLKLRPHLLKAVMLGGAVDKISGGADRVGVGAINYYKSKYTSTYTSWEIKNNEFSTYASTDSFPNSNSLDWNVNLSAGKETRVAISWLNRGTHSYLYKRLGMDFDLTIYDSNNNIVKSSKSRYNPYEVIDFTPSSTGTYRISIKRYANRDANTDVRLGAFVSW